jgi:hypothetical protein
MTSGANILSPTVRKIDNLVCVVDMEPGVTESIGLSRSTSPAGPREHPLLCFSFLYVTPDCLLVIFDFSSPVSTNQAVLGRTKIHVPPWNEDVHPDIAQRMSPLFRLTGTTATRTMTNTEPSACDACACECGCPFACSNRHAKFEGHCLECDDTLAAPRCNGR